MKELMIVLKNQEGDSFVFDNIDKLNQHYNEEVFNITSEADKYNVKISKTFNLDFIYDKKCFGVHFRMATNNNATKKLRNVVNLYFDLYAKPEHRNSYINMMNDKFNETGFTWDKDE